MGGNHKKQTLTAQLLLLPLLFAATRAGAAGIGIPDLGAGGLGQAGATVARPGDLTALYYNPGALAFLEGVQLYADARAIDHRITYQRLDAQGENRSAPGRKTAPLRSITTFSASRAERGATGAPLLRAAPDARLRPSGTPAGTSR
jgi:long-subunit fatty acid transport protein